MSHYIASQFVGKNDPALLPTDPRISAANMNKIESALEAAVGFSSKAELKAFQGTGFITRCHCAGYSWEWDALSERAENGGDYPGTVIEKDGHVGAGRWINTATVLTPQMFGEITADSDDTIAFQRCAEALKGDDATALNRSGAEMYIPFISGISYKLSDTFVIDGTHGAKIRATCGRSKRGIGFEQSLIRWYGPSNKPVMQIKGGAGSPSNPNFLIEVEGLGIHGYKSSVISPIDGVSGSFNINDGDITTTSVGLPDGVALSCICLGALDGDTQSVVNRKVSLTNVSLSHSRFGFFAGSPAGGNTDNAFINLDNCTITQNFQMGVHWGTGNTVGSIKDSFVYQNGWAADQYAADNYAAQKGANVYVKAGTLFVNDLTTAGDGLYKPADADIYQEAGQVNINNVWSDTSGPVFVQASASRGGTGGYYGGKISGIRHYNASFTRANTPTSIVIKVPGTTVTSCYFYGDFEIASGLSGRPVVSGINFGPDAGYTGDGINVQRSLIVHGHSGNNAQSFYGGANAGVPLIHLGVMPPNHLLMGGGTAGSAATHSLFQWRGATENDSSGTAYCSNYADGSLAFLINCYKSSATEYTVINAVYPAAKFVMSPIFGILTQVYDPQAGLTFTDADFVTTGKSAALYNIDGQRESTAFVPPKLASDPSTVVGEGGLYYNTTSKKMRFHNGTAWTDM